MVGLGGMVGPDGMVGLGGMVGPDGMVGLGGMVGMSGYLVCDLLSWAQSSLFPVVQPQCRGILHSEHTHTPVAAMACLHLRLIYLHSIYT